MYFSSRKRSLASRSALTSSSSAACSRALGRGAREGIEAFEGFFIDEKPLCRRMAMAARIESPRARR